MVIKEKKSQFTQSPNKPWKNCGAIMFSSLLVYIWAFASKTNAKLINRIYVPSIPSSWGMDYLIMAPVEWYCWALLMLVRLSGDNL